MHDVMAPESNAFPVMNVALSREVIYQHVLSSFTSPLNNVCTKLKIHPCVPVLYQVVKYAI